MLPPRAHSGASAKPMLLVSVLIAALVLLGVLQYRWSGQVSDAERQRMQGSLQFAVDQFRREFARDLLAAGAGLQADPETVTNHDWQRLAQTQSEYLVGAGPLVSRVYLWLAGEDGHAKLLRLDVAQAVYREEQAPSDVAGVVARFSATPDDHHPGPPRNFGWTMDGAAPALIRSVIPRPVRNLVPGEPGERRIGYQVILLQRETIEKKLLPELTLRYFGSPEGLIYQVQVYRAIGAKPELLYRSSGGAALNLSGADLDENLVEFRPFRGGPDRNGPDRSGGRFSFRGWPRRDGRDGAPDFLRSLGGALLVSDGVAPWRIAVRHRAGSVAAAVATLRWRNLGVTFAILLILGAGMLTIVRNTRRAQRLAELQMDFVAGVSHELRTPLAVIASAADNLTDGVVQGDLQMKQYGSLIRNESRRLAGMMEQILQFAAGQRRRPYKPVPLRVDELMEAALALSQTTLTEGGFVVECHAPPNLPLIFGESGALTQCLQNLISNAAKYSGDSRWIALTATTDARSVFITVEDRGIGIDPIDLPHLFDAFFRAKSVRSAQIHGTGLGLNLARSFALDAGGEITVESVPGQGSRFTVRLPVAEAGTLEPARLVKQTA